MALALPGRDEPPEVCSGTIARRRQAEAAKRLSELTHEQSELRRALSEKVSEQDLHAVAAASSQASPGGEEQRLLAEQLAEEMAQDMARKFAAELEARNRECDDLTAECDDLAKKLAQARLDSAEARTQLGRELAQVSRATLPPSVQCRLALPKKWLSLADSNGLWWSANVRIGSGFMIIGIIGFRVWVVMLMAEEDCVGGLPRG